MRNVLLGCLFWIVGMTVVEDLKADHPVIINEVRARGRCRRIFRERRNVVIQFMNEEDAEIFAKDLYNYLNDE